MTLENRMLADLNTAEYQRDMLDLKRAEALVNKSYKELSLLPDAQVAAISQGYMDQDGNVTQKGLDAGLETLGKTIVLSEIAATKGKTKTETDTQEQTLVWLKFFQVIIHMRTLPMLRVILCFQILFQIL